MRQWVEIDRVRIHKPILRVLLQLTACLFLKVVYLATLEIENHSTLQLHSLARSLFLLVSLALRILVQSVS